MSREISLLLAGDALLTRPWSHVRDADFIGLIEEIRDADVAIANLETVIHEFKGHAQADSGGTYMASPPRIATELKWAGFDMLAHANNHAFDYGASGILETLEHAEREGLIVAGSGPDLQRARAPRYLQCDGSRVALVAMAVDFVSYGKASASRPDLHGRPGINPLSLESERSLTVRPFHAAGVPGSIAGEYWGHRRGVPARSWRSSSPGGVRSPPRTERQISTPSPRLPPTPTSLWFRFMRIGGGSGSRNLPIMPSNGGRT
jgi:hypothetical protein